MDLVMAIALFGIVFFLLKFLADSGQAKRAKRLAELTKYSPRNVYGKAGWATEAMLKAAGLFKKRGLPLGYCRRRWWGWSEIFFDGRTHLITFGGTGTGKTTQALIPAAMRWAFSAVFL